MSEEITFAVTIETDERYWADNKADNTNFMSARLFEAFLRYPIVRDAEITVEQIHGPTNE